MNLNERLRDGLHAEAQHIEPILPPVEHIVTRARRSTVRRREAVGVATAVLAVGIATIASSLPPPPGGEVVDRPQDLQPVGTLEQGLLDGTRLRLTLPEHLTPGRSQPELTGSLYAAGSLDQVTPETTGWRIDVAEATLDEVVPGGEPIDVPDGSAVDAAHVDHADRRLGLQFGSWVAMLSGDRLTDADIDRLIDEVVINGTSDGSPIYEGTLPLWVLDGPEVRLSGDDTSISVFMRSCSKPSGSTTATGLTVSRIDDPARGHHLTVLCNLDEHLELWLETDTRPDDDTLATIGIEVLTTGTTLDAVQQDEQPGS